MVAWPDYLCPTTTGNRGLERRNVQQKVHTMETDTTTHQFTNLCKDVQALLSLTAHIAEENVVQTRKRVIATIEKGKTALKTAGTQVCETARHADADVRNHPYRYIAIGLGVGTILAFVISRKK